VILTVSVITTLNEMQSLSGLKSTGWGRELEWPQKVVGLLKVWTNGKDFVDQIFNTDDSILSKGSFNDGIVSQWDSLAVNLSISTLVDQFLDSLEVRITISNVRVNDLEHFNGCLCKLDKDSIVDLEQTQQLQNLFWLWSNLVDTR
jgi:hypothetical protein